MEKTEVQEKSISSEGSRPEVLQKGENVSEVSIYHGKEEATFPEKGRHFRCPEVENLILRTDAVEPKKLREMNSALT